MDAESRISKLEVRVDRNELDIQKLDKQWETLQTIQAEFSTLLQLKEKQLENLYNTLYGGNGYHSTVDIVDKNNQSIMAITHHDEIQDIASADFKLKLEDAINRIQELKSLVKKEEENTIQIGKMKFSGKSANFILLLMIPIIVVALLFGIVYIIMALMGHVNFPWVH